MQDFISRVTVAVLGLLFAVFINNVANQTKTNIIPTNQNFVLVDFRQPSYEKRLYVINSSSLVFSTRVSHGSGSGKTSTPIHFSNVPGSYTSSLGVMKVGESYYGKHGKSMRLIGLEPGINDNVLSRVIVIHSAYYVTSKNAGLSQGCLTVSEAARKTLFSYIKPGTIVIVIGNDDNYWRTSKYGREIKEFLSTYKS